MGVSRPWPASTDFLAAGVPGHPRRQRLTGHPTCCAIRDFGATAGGGSARFQTTCEGFDTGSPSHYAEGMRKVTILALVAAIAAGCGGAKATRPGTDSAEAWLSTTINGQKVGYSLYRFDASPAGYRFESFIKMTIAMAGKTVQVQSRSVANTASDLSLKDFSFTLSDQSASGRVVGDELKMTVSGGKQERAIKLAGPIYPSSALGRLVVARNLPKDSTIKVPVFDAAVLGVTPAEVKVLGREKVKAGGKEYDALKFTTRMAKIELTTWVDDKGAAIVEVSPPGIRSERTTQEQVLADEPERARFDVLTMFRVPVDTAIPEGARVNHLKLEITGVDTKMYSLTGPGQQVMSTSPLIVDIKMPDVPSGSLTLPVAGETAFLKPSVSVQSDAPEIKAKARAVLGGEKDATNAARKLVSWAYQSVEKLATASLPNALDVLKTMKGDCNEHAVLLAALCRAAGIPTKIAVGLVYMNRAYYYHAWDEVFLGTWIPVDATFGEFPASALHLKLAEGELSEQAEILGLVGTIGIKVREFGLAPEE